MWSARPRSAALVAFLLASLVVATPATAREIVIDLSSPVVKVTAGFAGTDILLYGAKQAAGDIIVVIRGPAKKQVVRRKEQVGGVWVNRASQTFKAVPSYYWVASNRQDLGSMLSTELRQIHQIGIDELDFALTEDDAVDSDIWEYRDAIKRIHVRDGLYGGATQDLIFLSDTLFKTNVRLPANVSVGPYGVDVYLVRDGDIVASETKILNVRKFGLEAAVYDFAHRFSFAYGIIAVIIALVAGWSANAVFRKR